MSRTILIVDDSATDAAALKEYLEEKYTVTQEDKSGETLSVLRERSAFSSAKLKTLFDEINSGVSVIIYEDKGGVRLAYANDRYYQLFGFTREQLGKEFKDSPDIVYPDDRDKVAAAIAEVKETKLAATFRYRIIKRDKSIAYLRCSSSVTTIDGVSGHVLISILTDITESVQAEQQAIASGQRLDAIMKNMNSAVTASIVRSDGKVELLFTNDKHRQMLGYTNEQYQAEVSDPFALVHPDDIAAVRDAVFSLRRVGDETELRYRIFSRDGKLKTLRMHISLMTFPDVDEPVQLAIHADVTDIVEAQEKLAAQHEQISTLLNDTPSGLAIVELDPNDIAGTMHTVYYNDRFISFSGYSREEYEKILKNREMNFVFDEDTPALAANIVGICGGEIGASADTTVRCHTKEGGSRWLLLTGQLTARRGKLCVINLAMVDVTERKQAIDRQRISEEMLRIAAETDQRYMIVYDVKNNTCRAESRTLFSAKYGEVFENIPQSLIDMGLTAPDSVDTLCSLFARIREGERLVSVSLQLRSGPNKYEWFECNTSTVFDERGLPDHAVLVFHNITEQRIKEAVFKKWQQSIDSRLPESYTLFRCNLSRDASLDEQVGELLKISFPGEAISFNSRTKLYAEEFVYPDDREEYVRLLDSDMLLAMYYRGEHFASLDYREIAANGENCWRRVTIETVEYPNSQDVQAFLMYEDIDEQKKAEIKAIELAKSDPLTGALNRSAFVEAVDALIRENPNSPCALIMLDMDGFKQINDTFGHAAGDQALQDITAVLQSYTRNGDLVCRLGGDEFLVWLRDVPYDAVIAKTAQQMCEHIRKAYSQEVLLSASAGIAVYPRDGRSYDELYPNADKALYKVKQTGKGSYAFYSATLEEPTTHLTQSLLEVRPSVRSAGSAKRRMLIVDDNEVNRITLKGFFKDEYHIEIAKNGTEALIRLRHFGPSISVVLLDLFMPDADGFAVLRRMQSDAVLRTIPVIVVTGEEERETLLKAFELGAAEYVTKPVDVDIIRMRVKAVISKAENERLRAQNSYLTLQKDEEAKYRTVLESTGTAVVEHDWRNHVFIYDGEISKHIAGNFDHRGLWHILLSDMVADSADVKVLQDTLMELARNRERERDSKLVMLKTPERDRHWFRVNFYKRVDDLGLADKLIITFNDVHDEVLASDRLLFQATRDELTGLYNRAGFLEKAAELISAKKPGHYVMACIDVERFQLINDRYGTERGDMVLRHIADSVSGLVERNGGLCCRYTADKFAALYPARLLDTDELAENHKLVSSPACIPRPLRLRVGRCMVNDVSLPASALFDRAAMAEAFAKGRFDTYIIDYDESMRENILREQQITLDMVDALNNGEFEPWFQPQYNHATGALIGAEALIRWRKNRKIISPGDFIPVFEKNGFIYEVDQSIWRQVCVLLRRWLDEGKDTLPVSVNISRYDMFQDNCVDVLTDLIAEYRLPVELLRLEITESAFSEDTATITDVAGKLIDAGFTVEIDDFGSGYSSLNTLKDVPASILKLDMRFFERSGDAKRGGNIVESIVRMTKWLGMAVIAEGVEDKAQADYLKSIGCVYIQGYLYARPMPVEEYEKRLESESKEAQLTQLQTIQNLDNNEFWDAHSMDTLIFNSYVGAACILELYNGRVEMLRATDHYARMLSGNTLEVKDLLSIHWSAHIDSRNISLFMDAVQESLKTKETVTREFEFCDLPQCPKKVILRSTLRVIATVGERQLIYCLSDNMTAQRAAEHAALNASQRINAVMANINGGISAIYLKDDRVEYVLANEQYYKILGYTREEFELAPPDPFDLLHPDDREGVKQKFIDSQGKWERYTMEYRMIRRDGAVRHILCNTSVVQLPGIDEPVQLAVTNDITQLREIQSKELAARDRLDTVMNTMSNAITAVAFRDEGMEFLFANSRFYEMYCIRRGSIGADHMTDALDLILPEYRAAVRNAIREAVKTMQTTSMEFQIQRPDGTVRWIHVTINMTRLADINAPVMVAVLSDISAEKEATERLRFLNDSARDILAQPDSEKAINDTLRKLLNFFAGERSYIFELNDVAQTSDNTYEICAPGVRSEKRNLQGVPYDTQQYWFDAFRETGFVAISDVAAIADSERAMRELLLAQDIRSIIVSALWRDGTLIGYICVDNPAKAVDHVSQLVALADHIAVLLTRRDLMRKIEHDSETVQQLMDDTPGGFLRMRILSDNTPVIVSLNEGLPRLLGMSSDEVVAAYGDNAYKCIAAEDYTAVSNVTVHALAGDGTHTYKCRLKKKDGTRIWVQVFGRFVRDENGRLFCNSYFTDITEKMATEENQKALLDNLPFGAAMYEFDGENLKALHINKRYQLMVGRTRNSATLEGFSPSYFIHPDDRSVTLSAIKDAVANHRDASCNIRVLYGENEYRAFHIDARIMPRPEGKYLVYAAYTRLSEQELTFENALPHMFSTIMESSTDLAFAKDINFRYICCSRTFATLLGLESENEVVGKTDYELFPKEIADMFRRDDSALFATQKPQIDIQEMLPSPDGTKHYIRTSKHLMRSDTDAIIGIYCTGRDITEIQEAYARLRLLTDSIPGGIATFRCSPESVETLYINDGVCKMMGYTREEYDAHPVSLLELVYDEDKPIIQSQLELVQSGEKDFSFVVRIHTKDGGYKWINGITTVTDSVGDVYTVNAVLTDVNEQQEEKERLRLAEEEYRIATEHSARTICRYNIAEMSLRVAYKAATRLALPAEIQGVPYEQAKNGSVSPDTVDNYTAFFEGILHGEPVGSCVFCKKLNDRWRWLSARSTSIFDLSGKPVSAIISFRDITEEQEKELIFKKWEQSLAGRKPEKFTLYRSNLNKDTSYDTKEGSLFGFAADINVGKRFNECAEEFCDQYVVEDDWDKYTELLDSDRLLANYYRGVRSGELLFRAVFGEDDIRWIRLSLELLQYPNSTDVEAYLMYEDINDTVLEELKIKKQAETDSLTGLRNRKAFLEHVKGLLKQKRAESFRAFFLLDIDYFKNINDTFGHSVGDESIVSIANVILSVIGKDGVVCRLGGDEFLVCLPDMPSRDSVADKARALCEAAHIAVKNDIQISVSIGIALFTDEGENFDSMYHKADKALYHVKSHGKNNFAFYDIDMEKDDNEVMSDAVGGSLLALADGKNTMLVVDDSAINRLVTGLMFKNDFTIAEAENGQVALDYLREHSGEVAMVLLDIMMPVMDGYGLLAAMKADPLLHEIPVIVISGEDDRKASLRAIQAGASEYIVKPVDSELLRLRVSSALSKAENVRLRKQHEDYAEDSQELRSYRSLMDSNLTVLMEYSAKTGVFKYAPKTGEYLKGTFDGRPIWRILAEDKIASYDDAEAIREMITQADKPCKATFSLVTPDGTTHPFLMKVILRDAVKDDAVVLITLTDRN